MIIFCTEKEDHRLYSKENVWFNSQKKNVYLLRQTVYIEAENKRNNPAIMMPLHSDLNLLVIRVLFRKSFKNVLMLTINLWRR